MMLSKIKNRAIDYIIENLGGSETDFCIDEIFIFFEDKKMLFVMLPKKFKLQKELGLMFFYINDSVIYDFVDNNYSLIDPIVFLNKKDNHKDYLESISLQKNFNYHEILQYLDKRGYLNFEDFERLFKNFQINSDNLILSFFDKQRTEILIEEANNDQISILMNFFIEIKADYRVNEFNIIVKKDLLNSKSFYDQTENLVIDRV